MSLTLLVYAWLVIPGILKLVCVASALVMFVCFGVILVNEIEWKSLNKWVRRVFACAPVCFAGSALLFVATPSKQEAAILIATYTATTVVNTTEAQKAMELLRLYVGKELDAELAKLKADK